MDEVDFYLEDLKSKFKKIDTSKYFLAYSGGRDSHFVYWFIKNVLKDNKIKIVSVNTLMEHHEIKQRMINNADVVLLPTKKHKDIKNDNGIPCFSKLQDEFIRRYQKGSRNYSTLRVVNGVDTVKFKLNKTAKKLLLNSELHKVSADCCKYLKKEPMKKFSKINKLNAIVCIRGSESIIRQKINTCLHKNGNFTPIYDLTDELLVKIENKYKIEIPKIYEKINRTGCMGCPYGKNIEEELCLISDSQKRFVVDYFKESYNIKGVNVGK